MDKELVGLMYSGGVDSVVCLKKLVEKGITPILFHVRTWKINKTKERKIRRNARRLSPKSPLYVWKPRIIDYCASPSKNHIYKIQLDETYDTFLYPLDYVDKLVLGYFREYGKGRRRKGEVALGQKQFIKECAIYHHPIIIPLSKMTGREVDTEFLKLPPKVQQDTVSSTRFYKFGGESVS